jgi:hypothetical protein
METKSKPSEDFHCPGTQELKIAPHNVRDQDNSIGIEGDYGQDGRDSVPERDKEYLFDSVQRDFRAHSGSCQMSNDLPGGSSPGEFLTQPQIH